MKQDQITAVFFKYQDAFSAIESQKILSLLKNAKEEAFDMLMKHQPAFSWKITLYSVAVALLAASAIPFGLSYDWGFEEYFRYSNPAPYSSYYMDSSYHNPDIYLFYGFISLLIGFIVVIAAGITFILGNRAKSKKEIIRDDVLKILNAFQAE